MRSKEHKERIIKKLIRRGFTKTKIKEILKGVKFIRRSRWGLSRLDLHNCSDESKDILSEFRYFDNINKVFVKEED